MIKTIDLKKTFIGRGQTVHAVDGVSAHIKEREVVVVKPRPLHVQDQGNFGVWNLVDEDAFARSFEGASCIAVGDGGVFCMCYHWVRCKHDVTFFFPL